MNIQDENCCDRLERCEHMLYSANQHVKDMLATIDENSKTISSLKRSNQTLRDNLERHIVELAVCRAEKQALIEELGNA